MNKSLLGVIIAATLVAVVVGAQASDSGKASPVAGSAQAEVAPASLPSQLVVYYFHGNARCPSCYKIEQYSKEAVGQNFSDELGTGKIVFRLINVDQAGNDHYVHDYQLYTKSLVISLVKDGRQVKFKNLEKVWEYLRDQNKFHEYVRDEIKTYLGEL